MFGATGVGVVELRWEAWMPNRPGSAQGQRRTGKRVIHLLLVSVERTELLIQDRCPFVALIITYC